MIHIFYLKNIGLIFDFYLFKNYMYRLNHFRAASILFARTNLGYGFNVNANRMIESNLMIHSRR